MENLKELYFNLESIYLLDAAICCKMRNLAKYLEGGVYYSGTEKAEETRVLLGKYKMLQDYIHSNRTEQQITIAGEYYAQIYTDGDVWNILESLKPMQAHKYGDRWIYRTAQGKARACYVNDTFNNWDI